MTFDKKMLSNETVMEEFKQVVLEKKVLRKNWPKDSNASRRL